MSSAERLAWQYGFVAIAGYAVYLGLIFSSTGSAPLFEVDYFWPMVWTIGGGIVGAIVLSILTAIVFPRDAGREDVRDKEISRFGDYVGNGFVVAGALAAMLMAMFEWDHFWIANVIYLGFILSAILSSVARVVAYRWGFQR